MQQDEKDDAFDANHIRAIRILEHGKWLAEQSSDSGDHCLVLTTRTPADVPPLFFESVQPSDPFANPLLSASSTGQVGLKEVKILTRKPQTRNVALAAILKKSSDDPQVALNTTKDSNNKTVKFQVAVSSPSLVPPPLVSSSNNNNSVKPFPSYPRVSLPPRLERLKAEQKERDQLNQLGLYANFNMSIPPPPTVPPPVPPPGLGFSRPPPTDQIQPGPWSLNPLPLAANAYSLFNSQTWQHPTPMATSGGTGAFPATDSLITSDQQRSLFGLNPPPPPSLWSGPGPSPLERLLEQQKASRGVNSPIKK